MAASLPVLTYWSDDAQTELVVQVGESVLQWARIEETRDGTYAVIVGWRALTRTASPENPVRLRCIDRVEACCVIASLAETRGLRIEKCPSKEEPF